jgi:DNA-binding HxlR family transcriptional regulator
MATKKMSDCPFSHSLDIWGDKWSLLIIRDMIFFNKNTYGEFLKSPEGIATNILASKLQQLEENGIIEKTEHPESKAKNLYRLTSKGIDLLPIFVEIFQWAEKYQPIPEMMVEKMAMFKDNKENAIMLWEDDLKEKLQ